MKTYRVATFFTLLLISSHMIHGQGVVPPTNPNDPAAASAASPSPPATDPAAATGNGDYTADPSATGADPSATGTTATGQCKSTYHTTVATDADCKTYCQTKVTKANGNAIVDPQTYDNNGVLCCNCRFKRLAPSNAPPGAAILSGGGISSSSTPTTTPTTASPIDQSNPATFRPPTQEEIAYAINPNSPVIPPEGTQMVYTVLRVLGTPWTLPLPFEQQVAFIYALSNVTGLVWQYMGAAVCVCFVCQKSQ